MRRLFQTGLTAALAAMLVGCGSAPLRAPQDRRPAGLAAGSGGGSWEAVLPGLAIAEAGLVTGAEASRRNESLSHRSFDAVVALDSWPERTRPELSRWRRLYLSRDARSVIYFEQGRREHHHSDHGYGGGYPRYDRYGRGGQY